MTVSLTPSIMGGAMGKKTSENRQGEEANGKEGRRARPGGEKEEGGTWRRDDRRSRREDKEKTDGERY